MASFEIPVLVNTQAPFNMQVDLDGENFDLDFRFFSRSQFWAMTIGKGGTTLIASHKIVNTLDLFEQFAYIQDMPTGTIRVHDFDGLDRDPNSVTFGDRIILIYDEA